MPTLGQVIREFVEAAAGTVTAEQIKDHINATFPNRWKSTGFGAEIYASLVNNPKAYIHHPSTRRFLFKNADGTYELYAEARHGPNVWVPAKSEGKDKYGLKPDEPSAISPIKAEKPCNRYVDTLNPATPASTMGLVVTHDLMAARKLRDAFRGVDGASLFGLVDTMPEEQLAGDITNEFDRLMYITLTVSLDYQRDAIALWRHSRDRYDDPATRWLFDPNAVVTRTPADILFALRCGDPRGALRYPVRDAAWWHRNASLFAQDYANDPRVLFEQCAWDVVRIRKEVRRSGRFQGLKGPKIFPLWMRMLKDIQKYPFTNFEALPIPVDVHVARATFTTGLIQGRYEGPFDARLIDVIRRAWTMRAARPASYT